MINIGYYCISIVIRKSPIKSSLYSFFAESLKRIMRKMSKEEFLEILSRQQRSDLTIKEHL